jgi:hypothetical protein
MVCPVTCQGRLRQLFGAPARAMLPPYATTCLGGGGGGGGNRFLVLSQAPGFAVFWPATSGDGGGGSNRLLPTETSGFAFFPPGGGGGKRFLLPCKTGTALVAATTDAHPTSGSSGAVILAADGCCQLLWPVPLFT